MIYRYSTLVLLGRVLGGGPQGEGTPQPEGSGHGSGSGVCPTGFTGDQCQIECDCNGHPCEEELTDRFSEGYVCLCGGGRWWTNNMTGLHCDQECNCNGNHCEHHQDFYCDGDPFACSFGGELPPLDYGYTCKCDGAAKHNVPVQYLNSFERTCGAIGYEYVCAGSQGDPWHKTWDTPADDGYPISIQGYCSYKTFEGDCVEPTMPYIKVVSQNGNLQANETTAFDGTYTIGLEITYRPANSGSTYVFSSDKVAGKRWMDNDRPWKMQGLGNPASAIWAFPNQKFPEIAAATRQEGANFAIYLGIGVSDLTGATLQAWKDDTSNAPIEDYAFKLVYNYYHYIHVCVTVLYQQCAVSGVYGNMNGQEDPGVDVVGPDQTAGEFYSSIAAQNLVSCENPGYNGIPPTVVDGDRKRRSASVASEMLAEQLSHSRDRRTTCTNEATYRAACEELTGSPFTDCGIDPTSFIETCVADACFLDNIEYTKCRTMEAFVSQCNADPAHQIASWRDTNRCPMTCPDNASYEGCTAPSCHASVSECFVDHDQCDAELQRGTCVEGCVCEAGFMMDAGGECVSDDNSNCVGPPPVNTAAMGACSVNPCLNSGVCTETGTTTYACACPSGFYGDTCEHEGDYEIELTCNSDATMLIVIKYGRPASLIGLSYGSCDQTTQVTAVQDISNDFNIKIDPAACGFTTSDVDAYHVTFQFGHEDRGMLLHFEDVQIAGSCSEIPAEVVVEYDYGQLTTNTEIHSEDGGSFTVEFEFTSYDSTFTTEEASAERAGDMIYLGIKLKSEHDADFGHAADYMTGPGRVWAPKSCKVIDLDHNLEYMLFENDGTAFGCNNDLVLLAVNWHQGSLMWSIEHQLFLLGTVSQSNYKLQCTLVICEHGTVGITQCLDIINSC